MAKEFKQYDIKFSKYKNTIIENITYDEKDIESTLKWIYKDESIYWTHAQVRFAVYQANSADEWQKFRVSLKGNSTRLKILRLQTRYELIRQELYNKYRFKIKFGFEETIDLNDELVLEKIRIDNYIGALRRSKHLNTDCIIVKD